MADEVQNPTLEQGGNRNPDGTFKSGFSGNPTGKGGLQDRPQDINYGGRPKNAESITYWHNFFLKVTVEDFKVWLDNNPENTRTMACELAYTAAVRARKDLKYLVEITDRTEGKSKQSIKHEGDLNITMQMKKLESVVDDLLAEDTEDTETN